MSKLCLNIYKATILNAHCHVNHVCDAGGGGGGRGLHVSCVPMREQKNDEKGYFFSSWAVCSAVII